MDSLEMTHDYAVTKTDYTNGKPQRCGDADNRLTLLYAGDERQD